MTTRGYGDRWWEQTKPADLEKTNTASAAVASQTSKDSYTKKISLPLVKAKQYKFFFTYFHQDPDTQEVKESDKSPVWTESFTIPNLTKAVQNLTLTAGSQSYGVKFNLDPTSVQEDVVIFESFTSDFASQTIVYAGTSTNVSILTTGANAFTPRWIKVRSRDKWDDLNISEATAGPVTPFSADVDTSTPPKAPVGVSVNAAIDTEDKSGFSIKMNVSWTASTDANTNGYVIRWSPNNPAFVTNPVWEYGQVDGRATNTFSITGLTPNTVYYWQVTAKSPFNAISWNTSVTGQVVSGTFGPISDPNAPDGNIQLRSILSIGGKTADLFKIGTGITQSINTSTTITPSLVSGTYNGIILDRSTTNFGHNYWLNTGQFRVGSSSSFLYWDGADIYTTGKINATGGSFTGDIQLASGTLYAGSNPNSGARVRLSNAGIFAYNSSSTNNTTGLTFSLQQSNGQIDAREGTVGGWTLATTGLSSTNTKIESNGTITLGDITGTLGSIIRLSATDPFRIWVGSQDSAVARDNYFAVSREGVMYARGAVITGNVQITSGSTYDSIVAAQAAAAAANSTAGTASTNATAALTTANGKNSIFRTGSTPTALKAGDIWINFNDQNKLYVAEAAGVNNWVLSRDASIAAAVATADDALAKATAAVNTANNAYPAANFSKSAILQAINASSNGTKLNGGVLEAGTVVADNVVSTYVYAGFISADKINAGTLQGRDINVTGETLGTGTFDSDSGTYGNISSASNAFSTFYERTPIGGSFAVKSVGVNAIALISTNTAGVTSSWYPYYDGSGDLGVKSSSTTSTFRWRNLRLTGSIMLGGDGSNDTPSTSTSLAATRPRIRIFSDGRIFANTLGTGSGNNIVQDGGYLNVQVSSLKYKENVAPIDKSGYLNIINSLSPVNYNYIGDTGYNGNPRKLSGLIAEDLHEIPQLRTVVNYDQDNQPDGIAYDRLVASVILAIQELSDKVDSISSRLDALES
jgi:hypothetical protein